MKIPEDLKWKPTGKTLGQGGQAQVLEVRDNTSDSEQTYALKPLGRNKPKQAFERFYREIRAIKAANHPYIIRIIDHSNEGDDFNFYVMELVPGAVSLKSLIESGNNPFFRNASKSLAFFMKLVEVVIECEENLKAGEEQLKVIHRDLSPANILVLPDESIKVIDFGVCQIEGAEPVSLVDEGFGTIDYMAPECGSGAGGTITSKADLYSAAKILWSAVTGRKAFAREEVIWTNMSLKSIFPEHPTTWHLSPVLEKFIQEKAYDRPTAVEGLELSKKIHTVIEGGFPPIELIGKQCPICGFGSFSSDRAWVIWHGPAPAGATYLECDNCGFYFAQNTITHAKNLKRGGPELSLLDRLRRG